MGFFVELHHCNPAGVCGGGMLASVLDHALGGAVMYEMSTDIPPATVSLHTDFVAPGRLGQWLETETISVSHKGALGYATILLRGPDGVVAQGSGICKVPISQSSSAA
jgi:acyl-coenzyme A thioesterase PaaI-like protein